MTAVDTVIYDEAGPFERSLAAAFIDTLPVPLREILDPTLTPAAFLPFLAARESVDLWFDDWSEARKRLMVADAGNGIAALKGTHEGVVRYLAYVDAEVIDTVSYPARFVLGRSALGVTPLQHPPFKARYLVKVTLRAPTNAFVLGRGALGRAALRAVDLEPILRAKRALQVAKGKHSEYLVSFAWRRPATFGDELPFDGAATFAATVERPHL
ncbi:phage tail protein I [Aureimonas phyllosphaerae]|uniref:P2-related tail formation protein n=1 Tax=Aureimonas phyllosphaerae TaxID=1166078 RepID=A0A7W6FWH7_9HYPH|nr:phage tail protein I [Aureimonas phyllosphaerae]MBB3937935.1 P2-related tail formation protein [Aureimonas phyllosphaerae]MBB3961892.1 P2-related tail formation protein [Aureimonas phyllosphaerae]SFF54489.1 phage tail protein, P2 protein I family [Aureimonas phyllosphaerae]